MNYLCHGVWMLWITFASGASKTDCAYTFLFDCRNQTKAIQYKAVRETAVSRGSRIFCRRTVHRKGKKKPNLN